MTEAALEAAQTAIYRQMAESIRLAHEINPNSWSVQFYEGRIIIFVSEYTAWLYQRQGSGRLEVLLESPAPNSDFIVPVKEDFRRTKSLGLDLIRVGVPHLEFDLAWPVLVKAHQDVVVALAHSVRRRTSRAASFDRAALREIEDQSGQVLPPPAYVADDIESLKLDDTMPSVVAQRFADSIHLANAINHRSWSVYRRSPNDPVLSLGMSNFLIWTPRRERIWVAVLFDHMDDNLRDRWAGNLDPDRLFDGDGGWYWAEGNSRESLIRDMAPAHDAAITRAANEVRNRAHRASSFDEMVLDEIETTLGEDLPRPGYIGELRVTTLNPLAGSHAESQSSLEPLNFIRDRAKAQGLSYTETQLASFYVALQTKGFVILSGISGTGKSKLAQAFVGCLPDATTSLRAVVADSGMIEITIKPYMLKHDRAYLPVSAIRGLGIPDQKETRKVRLEFDGVQAIGSFRRFEDRSPGSPLVLLTFTKAFANKIAALGLGASLFLEPEFDDDADIVGFRISAKRDSVPDPADVPVAIPVSNHLFLSVRPDWRDSRALLGYHNPLLDAYEWTAFLRFILLAAENYHGPESGRVAWFVILDEMNLAHVEYYFADLLSVLESGRDAEGWTREAIRIERPDPVDDQDAAACPPPAALHLPPNLYVVGTVNMDETTHAFSPKVLDRAFTIALSDVDFSHYPPEDVPERDPAITDADRHAFLRAFSRGGRFARIEKGEIAQHVARHPELRTWLQELNTLLARSRMPFGYRVFDEIVTFVGAWLDLLPEATLEHAFDLAVSMKVLPKFSGSAARIERPLLDMLAWCLDPVAAPVARIHAIAADGADEEWATRPLGTPAFPVTAMRVRHMLDTLATEGFASFGR